MPNYEFELSSHSLRLDGHLELLFRPGTVTAFSGSFRASTVPVRTGDWKNLPRRLLEPDRYQLRRGELKGTLWLSTLQSPWVCQLPRIDADSLQVVTPRLLAASLTARCGSRRLRLVPGSTTKTLTVTELRLQEEDELGAVVATEAPLDQAVLEEGETLHVSPGALVAWSGCPYPKPFCATIRLRDMFLPRLPETLTLDFQGPGRVFFQGTTPPNRRSNRAKGMFA